ncbi:porin [Azospirillum rugosum]|uniref:Porin n=2 Tax=Azospirillum rugosum TaxID=416170 RepID=A0ABS4SVH5_9PROT|nr:porin [Azospirillum rugosum]MBP2296063.1 putative porin [Azospirillum rugosum]MDQ0530744.1 putative porin [Azospirillum rugosum]
MRPTAPATAALACLALSAPAAAQSAAQSAFDVTIGGDAYVQGAYVNQKQDSGLRSTEFANRFRLVVTPSATADNGLTYGARVRIVAGNGNPAVSSTSLENDRAFLFVNGGFGTVQAGMINGLSDEYGMIGPNVEGVAGSPDSNGILFLNGSSTLGALPLPATSLRTLVAYDTGTKFIYITPSFAGLSAAVSYTPRLGDANNTVNRLKRDPLGNAPSFHDIVEFGAAYLRNVDDLTIEASAFYQTGQANGQTDGVLSQEFEDLRSVHVGANVGYGPVKVGASYAYSGDSGYAKGLAQSRAQQNLIVGAQYSYGPLLFAANYLRALGNDSATMTTPAKADIWQGGITWTVAPGLTTGLEYDYVRSTLSGGAVGGGDLTDRAHILMLDTRIAF